MDGPVDRALERIRGLTPDRARVVDGPVTLNFHPDTCIGGVSTMALLARDGVYRSQFETGTSNGGRTAYPGGERWGWESRIFGRAYDDAAPALRPKYGGLNHRLSPVGGSPRFGSCYLRLRPHLSARTTFCYPDSCLEPQDFAFERASVLVALADDNRLGLDPVLDNCIEAHVHGVLSVAEDVEAVVLDPSYRNTAIEEAARGVGCPVEWHDGFSLVLESDADWERFRGPVAAEALTRMAVRNVVTPAILGARRDKLLSYGTAKLAWHCVARFGREA